MSEVIDFKGKKGNIRGFTTLTPPLHFQRLGQGGVWFCGARQHLGVFIKQKQRLKRENDPHKTCGARVVPVVPVE